MNSVLSLPVQARWLSVEELVGYLGINPGHNLRVDYP